MGNPKPTTVWGITARLSAGGPVIAIPLSRLQHTTGLQLYRERRADEPLALCPEYIANQTCASGQTCPLLHCEHAYYAELRDRCQAHGTDGTDPCCGYCGCVFTRAVLHEVPSLQLHGPFVVHSVPYPIERLALTCAVQRLAANADVSSEICPEHLAASCSRGKDCTMLHVCRRRYAAMASTLGNNAPQPAAPPMPAAAAPQPAAAPAPAVPLPSFTGPGAEASTCSDFSA